MCPIGATCLPDDSCFSEHYDNPTKTVGLVQNGHHLHYIKTKQKCGQPAKLFLTVIETVNATPINAYHH
jgi:hypothetical protein